MAIVAVASNLPEAGKTSVAAGLATLIARSGRSCAVCKPVSANAAGDADVAYFAHHFGGDAAVASLDDGSAGDAVASAVNSLRGGHDHLVVEVANPASGSGVDSQLTLGLANQMPARVVAVFGYRADLTAVAITSAVAPLGESLAGVIVNQAPRYREHHVDAMLAEVARAGVPVIGALPEDRAMLALSMRQLADGLEGRWELPPENDGEWVDRFLIGGNIMDSGAGYFGRFAHQAVITRAERPDIQMASLMQETRCLVLTGGSRPTEYIRVEAAKRAVPVLLVESGTVDTADAIGGLIGSTVPHALHKAERMADLLAEQVDLATLLS